ncbi:MAG: choice-of-anchor Q domain-containing protein [Thermoproteota archaeon]
MDRAYVSSSFGSITLTNNTFSSNSSSGSGGGAFVYSGSGSITLTNNTFSSNSSSGSGGGAFVYSGSGSITLTNNTFNSNSAAYYYGGGAYVYLENDTATLNFYNNILWNNTANPNGNNGDDLYVDNDGDRNNTPSPVNLAHNLFSTTATPIDFSTAPQTQKVYIWLTGNYNQNIANGCTNSGNFGNIQADPLFVDTQNGNLRLQENSPARNAGCNGAPSIPNTDRDGNPRMAGTAVDMGAYEYQYTITASANPPEGGSITCTPNPVNHGQTATCTITANENYTLQNVGGTCGGTLSGNTYTTNAITSDCTVVANFSLRQYTLTVNRSGNGSGTISAKGCTLSCTGNTCTCTANVGTQITLSASANQSSVFAGWSNGTGSASCTGTGQCTITLNQDSSITATFNLKQYTITASANPPEGGSITCTPNPVNHGQTATCTITANENYTLQNVGGTCGGTLSGNTYTTNAITSDCTVVANFSLRQYTLTVNRSGTGSGTVTSNPYGINCGSTCSANFDANTTVTLTATASSGSTFAGWGGDCSSCGNNTTCQVSMTSAKTCTVTFNPQQSGGGGGQPQPQPQPGIGQIGGGAGGCSMGSTADASMLWWLVPPVLALVRRLRRSA